MYNKKRIAVVNSNNKIVIRAPNLESLVRCPFICVLLSSIVLFLSFCFNLEAGDFPYRNIILGRKNLLNFQELSGFDRYMATISGEYKDFYYQKNRATLQDYHQSDMRVNAFLKKEHFLYGFEYSRDILTLSQNNVYTDSNRLRGTHENCDGKLFFGIDRAGRDFPAGITGIQTISSFGYEKYGYTASIHSGFLWKKNYKLFLEAESFPTRIELEESMFGYKFPLHFPFRTNCANVKVQIPIHSFELTLRGSFERSRGDGENVKKFLNKTYYRSRSVGGMLAYNAQPFGNNERLLRKEFSGSKLPGITLEFDSKSSNFDISMYHHEVRYLHIKDFYTYDNNLQLNVLPFETSWFFAGWERIRVEHSGTAFFDRWPFIVWDYFSSSRYLLGYAEGQLDILFIGGGTFIGKKNIDIEILGRLEQLRSKGNIIWYNRYFRGLTACYERHQEKMNLSIIYAFQLMPSITYNTANNLKIRLSLNIFIPFSLEGRDKNEDIQALPVEQSDNSKRHGGLWGKMAIIYSL